MKLLSKLSMTCTLLLASAASAFADTISGVVKFADVTDPLGHGGITVQLFGSTPVPTLSTLGALFLIGGMAYLMGKDRKTSFGQVAVATLLVGGIGVAYAMTLVDTMTTAADGSFSFTGLEDDTYMIVAFFDGYLEEESGDIIVAGSPETVPDITLDVLPCLGGCEFTASDADTNISFGNHFAMDGDTLIVGAYEGSIENGQPNLFYSPTQTGSAYIFNYDDGQWVEQAKLEPSPARNLMWFGLRVDIDGDYAVVGAPVDTPDGNYTLGGSAYIFHNDNGTWTQQALLQPSDPHPERLFGCDVAIVGDHAYVSSYKINNSSGIFGKVYVYERSGSTWTEIQNFTGSMVGGRAKFGLSFDIEGDRMVVGALGQGGPSPTNIDQKQGAVYYFERESGVWVEKALIYQTDPDGEVKKDMMGLNVELDGHKLLASTYQDTFEGPVTQEWAGSVYAFEQLPDGNWTQTQEILSPTPWEDAQFGFGLTMDGNVAYIGEVRGGTPRTTNFSYQEGVVYRYEYSGGTWTEVSSMTGPNHFDRMGSTVLYENERLLIGVPHHDGTHSNQGKFVFRDNMD